MAISADEHNARIRIVLEDDLMDDTTARLPKTHAKLGSSRRKKVVDLLVDILGTLEVRLAAHLGLNQVVTVDGGRHGGLE